MESMDKAFAEYFSSGTKKEQVRSPAPETPEETGKDEKQNYVLLRQMADGNIDDVEQFASILKRICNAAWGSNWGELSLDLKEGESPGNMVLPQITIGINEKDLAKDRGMKPMLYDTVIERNAEGDKTGEVFFLYRQWFDYNIEINVYGQTSIQAREIKNKLQKLISVYTGYLKRQGISEIYFEKEVHSKMSLNYNSKAAMIPVYYYVRMEEITVVRKSVLDKIDVEIGIDKINTETITTIIENGEHKKASIDLHYYAEEDKNNYDF